MYSLSRDGSIFTPYKYMLYLSEEELYQGLLKINPKLWMQKNFPITKIIYFNTQFQRRLIFHYSHQMKPNSDYLINGFSPNNEEWNINEEQFLKNNLGGLYNSIQDEGIQLVKEIITLCKRYSIILIFVNTPEYYKILPLQINRNNIISIYKNISETNEIRYMDYTENEITKNKNYFYNFTHLNSNGAKRFSEMFSYDLLNYLKIQKR